ncbi:hypothetical protein V865_002928 [Kwoniella europaea PYCC6329]|uniref:Leucine-rich repeat-containing N-terminal plant-type domain-containing protein n=1 Tax=Kwoniella europaea PYCC6329 TaxID=1423913 RepID=A0AAX4KEL3_9TREE
MRLPLQTLFTILLFLTLQSPISAFLNLSFLSPSSPTISSSLKGKNLIPLKQYLSSSKRTTQPRRFGYFSFSRHPRSLPDWDPLEGVEGVLVHRGIIPNQEVTSLKAESVAIDQLPNDDPVEMREEDMEGQLEERDDDEDEEEEEEEEFILEDCEKRQDNVNLGNSQSLIAELGSIPQEEVSLAQTQSQEDIGASDQLDIDPSSSVSMSTDGGAGDTRKHNDKILWSGLESLLPLEKGIMKKRHSDKSGGGRKYHSSDGGGKDDEGDYSPGRGRKGSHGDDYGSGRKGYGKHDNGYDSGSRHSGQGQGGWNDANKSHRGGNKNGEGRPGADGWHKGGSGDGGNENGRYQEDWERPSSSSSNNHHGHGSGSNDDDGDEGWYHGDGSDSSPKGDGNRNGKWDEGPYRPWKSNSNTNSIWDHHPSSSDWDNHPWHPSSNTNTNSDTDHGFSSQSSSNNHRTDCTNLSSFYKSAQQNGGEWLRHNGWSSSGTNGDDTPDCCTWFGVTCDPISRRVTALNLRNNGLEVDLFRSLFNLDALMRLDLSQNTLSSLPDTFDSLPRLIHLNISSSSLSSFIPSSISTSTSLINLDLSNNLLVGNVHLSASTLKSVDLSNNKLSSFSISPSGMNSLSKFVLKNNNFEGELPDLSGLRSLQSLDVSYNNTGALFDTSNLTNLTRLDVRSNQLTGSFPILPSSIQSLYLSSNQFTGPILSLPAPKDLTSCYILPNNFSPCPSKEDLSDPNTLASKCHLKTCGQQQPTITVGSSSTSGGGTGATIDASQVSVTTLPNSQKGIPVNPLPGENLNNSQNGGQPVVGVPSNEWQGLRSKNQQNQLPQAQSQRLGSNKLSSEGSNTIHIHGRYTIVVGLFVSYVLFSFGSL